MATKHPDSAPRLGGVLISNQVVAELLEQLRNGIWQDTDHLPPELELANRLNVSRTVVRDALSELERAGYIERVRGIGTVINRDVVNLARRMDQKFEFTQMIRARGMQPNSDDLRVSRHTADADAAGLRNHHLAAESLRFNLLDKGVEDRPRARSDAAGRHTDDDPNIAEPFAQGDLPLHPVADRLQFFQRFHTVFRSFLLTSLGLSSKVR